MIGGGGALQYSSRITSLPTPVPQAFIGSSTRVATRKLCRAKLQLYVLPSTENTGGALKQSTPTDCGCSQ
eukprot:5491340-Amphidinium_carterae.1